MNRQIDRSFTSPSDRPAFNLSHGTIPRDSFEYSSRINHQQSVHSPTSMLDPVPLIGPIVSLASNKGSGVTTTSVLSTKAAMDSMGANVGLVPLSRLQEKEELQRLNDRFSAYVARVRNLGQQGNNVDTSAFLQSTKILEDEITSLKNMYQTELDKLRNEIEAGAYERNSLHAQCNKQQKYIGELQDRLTIETDKNRNMLDEINMLQRKIGNLEGAVQDAHIAAQRPQEELDHLQRNVENLSREVDQWKHRCEQEHVANQQGGERLQQIMMKADFSEQVQNQQIQDYQTRLDTTSANILSLEARVRELSTTDVSIGEILKQVRGTAEAELMKYQIESEDQYNRNLSTLKGQIEHNGITIQRFSEEKNDLAGCIGELQAKIRNLEGQVANLQHQKRALEDASNVERSCAADNIVELEKKLRDVQDMLVTKMFELTSARESNIPLKVEIEALKALLEEEERRLRVPLVTSSTSLAQPNILHLPTTSEILKTNSLCALKAAASSHMQPPVGSSYVQSLSDSRKARALEVTNPLHQYDPYGYYSTSYIPESLHSGEEHKLAYDADYEPGLTSYDLYRHEVPQTSQYFYESSPSLSRLHVDQSLPGTPRALGPVQSRAHSAPVKSESDVVEIKKLSEKKTKKKKWNYIPSNFGFGRDYFDEMFYDLQNKSLFSNRRPKSSPMERKMPSSFHDYTVSTFSATGDLKIQEVNENGRYVQLVNDGTRELDIGGYMIRQNVDGHAVAIFKFPPHTHFPPNSTVTVWAAMNNPNLHNPPTDFFWSEQEKWETGPESSTILCRSNGQAVAWTTAAHRHTRNALEEATKSKPALDEAYNQADGDDTRDDKTFSEQNMDCLGPKPESASLKREKRQPPLLASTKISNGSVPAAVVHPQSAHLRNEGSLYSHQPKSQAVTGQLHSGAQAQRVCGMPLMNFETGHQPRPPTIRGNGTLINKQSGSIQKASCSPYIPSLQEHLINGSRDHIFVAS